MYQAHSLSPRLLAWNAHRGGHREEIDFDAREKSFLFPSRRGCMKETLFRRERHADENISRLFLYSAPVVNTIFRLYPLNAHANDPYQHLCFKYLVIALLTRNALQTSGEMTNNVHIVLLGRFDV